LLAFVMLTLPKYSRAEKEGIQSEPVSGQGLTGLCVPEEGAALEGN
jgi:hypothetical protein